MITGTALDSGLDFFQEAQIISDLHKDLKSLLDQKKLRLVEQKVKDNSDLLVKHWKSTLCMTGLSHDFIITHLFLLEIQGKADEKDNQELFKFLLNLDRLLEIDLMQQLTSIVRIANDVERLYEIDYTRATRSVIRNFIENELNICILNKSNLPCYLNVH